MSDVKDMVVYVVIPDASTATPVGYLNLAEVAAPPSPLKP